jgi:hypothetical protein
MHEFRYRNGIYEVKRTFLSGEKGYGSLVTDQNPDTWWTFGFGQRPTTAATHSPSVYFRRVSIVRKISVARSFEIGYACGHGSA